MINSNTERQGWADEGIGLVEIVVSMFLLALIAVSFLPILIQGMLTSVRNATTATASQLVSQQLDEVRVIAPNCTAVSAFDDVTVASTTDPRGTVYQPHRQVGTCPGAYPGVVSVRAWVTASGNANPLAEAITLVYVGSQVAP